MSITRDQELDVMDMDGKKSDILSRISEHGCIRLTTREAFGFWHGAVKELEVEGRVTSELVSNDIQQYSFLVVRLV